MRTSSCLWVNWPEFSNHTLISLQRASFLSTPSVFHLRYSRMHTRMHTALPQAVSLSGFWLVSPLVGWLDGLVWFGFVVLRIQPGPVHFGLVLYHYAATPYHPLLRQVQILYPKLVTVSRLSCFSLLNDGIIGVYRHLYSPRDRTQNLAHTRQTLSC